MGYLNDPETSRVLAPLWEEEIESGSLQHLGAYPTGRTCRDFDYQPPWRFEAGVKRQEDELRVVGEETIPLERYTGGWPREERDALYRVLNEQRARAGWTFYRGDVPWAARLGGVGGSPDYCALYCPPGALEFTAFSADSIPALIEQITPMLLAHRTYDLLLGLYS